ncbi:hypothetical protein AKJ53_01255 [candidate division MSBL1 archaeon SCGC-AAA382F02]|uniref:Riboflavin kinase n=1 Tax=candidate division MSBL1 archaeon SCGC-AAA382F02 TaxID=1698282 RepID=A0A133VIB1_9EURY|nr:hypothetical protein AKJ53_01255 [candidate division MSBL1 archaeon SCGC-AAA382F02]
MKKLQMMLELAKLGADSESIQISSSQLAEKVGCSQQTAARWLSKLSEEKLIKQNAGAQGQIIEFTSKGVDWLKSLQQDIQETLEAELENLVLIGEVTSGLDEGSYYIGQKEYQEQFKEKLGFEPYPGTLDIKLDRKSLELKKRLQTLTGRKIEGFSTEERSFGDAECFPAKVKGEEAAVVMPSRSQHGDNIIEIISPTKIRDKYDLDDGDEIKVEVEI